MAQPPSLRPSVYPQSRSKSTLTSNNGSGPANATSISPQRSRPSSQTRRSSPVRTIPNADASDKVAIALIRRVLCAHAHSGAADPRPVEELLPPLTSSNDVDLQLYALIAIIVKDLVQGWYGKITPDQAFVEELVRVVAHCTRALEQRLRHIDLAALIFDEIPELVESHIVAYRASHQPMLPCLSTKSHIIYHQLNHHPAMSPVPDPAHESTIKEQLTNEAAYRQLLVQGALAVLLPTEELENVCVRTLIADVLGETLLGSLIGGKACEARFIWNNIIKIVEMIKSRQQPYATGEDHEIDHRSRLEKFGLVSDHGPSGEAAIPTHESIATKVFWQVLQYGYLTISVLWFMIGGLVATSSRRRGQASSTHGAVQGRDLPPITKIAEPPNILRRPVLHFRIFPLISVLLNLPHRMPWLSGILSLLQHQLIYGPWKVGVQDGLIDLYIHHLLQTHLPPSTFLPRLLLALRTTLFPHSSLFSNNPSPPPPPSSSPSDSDTKLKSSAARSIRSLIPAPILARFFASPAPADWDRAIEAELDVWADPYLNRHLAYAVLELIAVRVLPELKERGVRGLMEGRGIVVGVGGGAGGMGDERDGEGEDGVVG